MNKTKRLVKQLLDKYPAWLAKKEYEAQRFTRFNERAIEYRFVFRQIASLYPFNVLDVGTGKTALPSLIRHCGCVVTATDNVRDYWPTGMKNRHFHVVDDDIVHTQLWHLYEMITCISVLEHVKDSEAAVHNMVRLLKPGGNLVLTFPYTEHKYVENVYELTGSSYGQHAQYVCQSYSRVELNRWFNDGTMTIVEQEYWRYWDGDYWTVGEQIIPPIRVSADEKHQLTCLLVRKQA